MAQITSEQFRSHEARDEARHGELMAEVHELRGVDQATEGRITAVAQSVSADLSNHRREMNERFDRHEQTSREAFTAFTTDVHGEVSKVVQTAGRRAKWLAIAKMVGVLLGGFAVGAGVVDAEHLVEILSKMGVGQ